jgi:hypothetical protein
MAKATTVAVPAAPAAPEHHRLSMAERLSKKTAKMGNLTVALEDVSYNVTVTGRVPVELFGHLIDLTDKYVVFRYKKERSSKTVISRFLNQDVVRVIGEVGEPASIVVMRTAPVPSSIMTGRVTVLKSGFVKVVSDNGDSMLVNPNLRLENYSLYINAEMTKEESEEGGAVEAPAAAPRNVGRPAARPAVAAAPAPRGKVSNLPVNSPKARRPAPTVQAFAEDDDTGFDASEEGFGA